MKVVTGKQMQMIDKNTIENIKIPGIILMENAGIRMTECLIKEYPDIAKNSFSTNIIVGPGNNGGDGLVIARQLNQISAKVNVYLIAPHEKFKGDALINLEAVIGLGIPHEFITDEKEFEEQKENILACDLIIDAIFGTGLSGEPRSLLASVIKFINKSFSGAVVSVDTPSGLLSTLEGKSNIIIKADMTITVGLPKIRMVDFPGKRFVGNLKIVQIGFPANMLENPDIKINQITKSIAREYIPLRPRDSHKGNYGHILLIGGSDNLGGATVLAGLSSLRTGAGLVTLASLKSVVVMAKSNVPEIMSIELPGSDDGYIEKQGISEIANILPRINTIIFGPGIGRKKSTFYLLKELLKTFSGKILIDADGLNLLLEDLNILKETDSQVVLTPHIGEMSRLAGKSTSEIIENKIPVATKFAHKYKAVLVLKSAVTLIASPDGELFFSSTGNSGMATGGSGDVLSGIIGGLMAQGLLPLQASILGVHIHGLSGDIARKKIGIHSIIASDLINNIGYSFSELQQK